GFVSLVGIPSVIPLAVAVFTVHLPYGFSSIKLLGVSNGRAQFGPPGYECDLLYIASIVVLLLSGPTPWSVDNYRSRAPWPSSHALRLENTERPVSDAFSDLYRQES